MSAPEKKRSDWRVDPALLSQPPTTLFTAEQLAARWQVPRSQVYRLTRDGRLPVVGLGRYYRYTLTAIESFETHGGTDDSTKP